MKIKVEMKGGREFKRQLKKFGKAIGKDIEGALIEYGVSGGRQLAMSTEPYGLGKKAREIGEAVVEIDVNKVYMDVGRTHNQIARVSKRKAAGYLRAVKEGNDQVAESIARNAIGLTGTEFDGGNLHSNQRNKRGRVKQGNKASNPIVRGDVQAYKARKRLAAGTAKAGWFSATKDLRGKKARVPKWLKKEGGLGTGRVKKRGYQTTVTLTNNVKYVRNVLHNSKIQRAIIRNTTYFTKRMTKTIEATNRR